MLTGLTKAGRKWMAMGFIALYALCIIAPTAAVAFTGVSCLTEHSRSQIPGQAGDAVHELADEHSHTAPADNHDDDSAASKCCGMVFCSAMVPDLSLALAPDVPSGRTAFAAMRDFTGLPPYKLIRPPRSQS